MTPAGFPHSDIHGSKLESSSPWHFAGFRVLHRLLVPRHPPCALCSLTCWVSLDTSGPVNHRQMGGIRGSFRHHEPYCFEPQLETLESLFTETLALNALRRSSTEMCFTRYDRRTTLVPPLSRGRVMSD